MQDIAREIELSEVAGKYTLFIDLQDEYKNYEETKVKLETSKTESKEDLEKKIAINKDVTSRADELNESLKKVFPFRKIEVVDSSDQSGYVIRRDGLTVEFESLSEGELNFLAFSYFMISLENESKKIEKKDRKSTRLNSSHIPLSRMPSSA